MKKEFLRGKLLMVFTYFWSAVFFAGWYATIEKQPYMQGIPAWRPNPHIWWVSILFWVPNCGRPVNGPDTFGLLFAHTALYWAPLVVCFTVDLIVKAQDGATLRLVERMWVWLMAYMIVWNVIEDWVWYAVNPIFGLSRFNASHIPHWMQHAWFLGFPAQYWEAFIASILPLLLDRMYARNNWRWRGISFMPDRTVLKSTLKEFFLMWGLQIMGVLIIAFIADFTWMQHLNFPDL